MSTTFLTLLAALPSVLALERPNGVGRLPALGWNSWNAFRCDINEERLLTAANKMIELGLQDAGYEYVNIDDCWSVKEGRDSDGRLLPDLNKFPDGIKGAVDKVHDLGFKAGIYSSAGTLTCAGYPASIGFEDIDAQTWAEWGLDYLKYDNCNIPEEWRDECEFCTPENRPLNNGTCVDTTGQCPQDYDWSKSKSAERFRRMRDALGKQERVILYSLCQWGNAGVQQWGKETGASWRSTGDIFPYWNRVTDIWNQNSFYMNNVDFWGHSDADMLEIGNGELNFEQGRTHFAVWAIMKSPLLIGTPLDTLSAANVEVLKNKYLLSFNQDPKLGRPAAPYKWGTNPDWTFDWLHPAEYWSGSYSNGDTIVLIFNPNNGDATRRADFAEIPQTQKGGSYRVIDAWTGDDKGCVSDGYDVQLKGYGSAVLVLKNDCGYEARSPSPKSGKELRWAA